MLLGKEAVCTPKVTSLSRRKKKVRTVLSRFASVYRNDALVLLRVLVGYPTGIYDLRAWASFRDLRAFALNDVAFRDASELSLNLRLVKRDCL